MTINDDNHKDDYQISVSKCYTHTGLPTVYEEQLINSGYDSSEMINFSGTHPNCSESTRLTGHSKVRPQNILSSLSRNLLSSTVIGAIKEIQEDDRQTSTIISGWSVLNLIQGIGILGIPFAISQGGWAAVVLNIVVAIVTCYTGILVVDCLYMDCPITKRRVRILSSYSDIGAKVWPHFGRHIITIVSVIEMFGALILYIILLTTMLNELFGHWNCPWKKTYNMDYFGLIATYSTLPLLFVTKMSLISWFSMVAIVGLMASVITIFVFCFLQFEAIELTNMPGICPVSFPVSIGIIVFSYCAHAVFPSIEQSMRKPKSYSLMMASSFSFSAIVKACIGVLTVLIFGSNTAQEITSNIENKSITRIAISVMILINVFFSVPLVIFVVSERFDSGLLPHFHSSFSSGGKLHFFWLFMTRALLLTSGLFVAMNVPQFALLMSVVGSITGSLLCFVFPCWFHLKLKYNNLTVWSKALRVIIILSGFVAAGFGVTFSTMALSKAFEKN